MLRRSYINFLLGWRGNLQRDYALVLGRYRDGVRGWGRDRDGVRGWGRDRDGA